MKIYRRIKNENDCKLLQEDLESFQNWCLHNNLVLNVDKCQQMSFTRRHNSIKFDYSINNIPLRQIELFNDLGVTFDSKMTFNRHIENICNKASSMLGFIKRWAKEFDNTLVTISLYKTLIRPHLEYGSQVWSPHYNIHIERVEKVQKRFVRFVLNYLNWSDPRVLPPYSSRLKLINLESLEERRKNADIVFMHQLCSGSFDSPDLRKYFQINCNRHSSRSSSNFFYLPFSKNNYSLFSPINRMCSFSNSCDVFDINISKYKLKCNLRALT